MKKKRIVFVLAFLFSISLAWADAPHTRDFKIQSPDANLTLQVKTGEQIQWSVEYKGQPVINPSSVSLELGDGEILGRDVRVKSSGTKKINSEFKAINYWESVVKDQYTELILNCKNDFGLKFRVYNNAVAYRFFTKKKGEIIVKNEEANFNFPGDDHAFIPYLWDYRGGQLFNASFESPYTEQKISEFAKDSLAILPLLVDVGNNKKVVILEADLEDYPGMYLDLNHTNAGFKGVYAPYPLEARSGGYNGMNFIPTKRADYIARTSGTRSFPWRVVAVSEEDKELLNNDIVQKLASPPRMDDYSWVEPGQAAWDWWDGYDLFHVGFKAGMNTATFQYYIDFAAANHARYIILDEGWSDIFDLNKINPEVDLEEIVGYAKKKNIGVILWASWHTITRQMEEIFPKYAKMGIKGWKIDFVDRDDQLAVASTYDIAKLAAKYKFTVDYHGVFKPTGLQRTYPNVVGYEGVYGLENFKWADMDAPRYAVTIPYIRNMAGPVDYTSGSMRNATQADFVARNHAPMSKGTRCNQLAQYVVFATPVQMLSDSPTWYMKEQECTDFITSIPTVFDETVPLDGKVGEFAAIARRKGDTWYIGAMTNWTSRDLTIDFSFLDPGNYTAVIFKDGMNADTEAMDYQKEVIRIAPGEQFKIHLAGGGGWAARIEKK
jgi:alpha-glucosidase